MSQLSHASRDSWSSSNFQVSDLPSQAHAPKDMQDATRQKTKEPRIEGLRSGTSETHGYRRLPRSGLCLCAPDAQGRPPFLNDVDTDQFMTAYILAVAHPPSKAPPIDNSRADQRHARFTCQAGQWQWHRPEQRHTRGLSLNGAR